jgi:hypothetical protein
VADLNLFIDRNSIEPSEPEKEKVVIKEEVTGIDADIFDFVDEFAEEITGEKAPIQEVSPPGWGHTKGPEEGGSAEAFDNARKEGRFKGSKEDMFAIMWASKNKGDKTHYKEKSNPPEKKKGSLKENYDYIDKSAERVSQFLGDTGKTVKKEIAPLEERYNLLEAKINKIQQITKSMFPGNPGDTIVSGIGNSGDGSTQGGGAVWLWDLNDVEIGTPMNGVYPDITDGSVLVYDAATDKWKPGDGGGGGDHESNLQTGGVIQKDGGEVNNTGALVIKQDAAGAGGDLMLTDAAGATYISAHASSGRLANIHRLGNTPSLELGQCGPSGSQEPIIGLENGAPTGTNTAPRLTLLNSHTQTPQPDGSGNLRYNLTIKAGTQTNIRLERGTNNGGWTSLYIEGKTVNYDPSAAGSIFNSTNDPKKYPLINLFRSSDNNGVHVADAINYRGRTDSQYYLQTKESVQALIDAGGGGVGFEFSGLVNVRMATSSGNQPTHTGDLTDPTPGAFYINTTAGTAYNADDVTGAGSWIGIAGLDISQDQLIIWSETAQRWFAGAVEDNTSFLKINGTNNMLECLNVVLNTPAQGASNAALTIRKEGDSQAKTTIYAGGSMDVGGTIKCSANIIPETANSGNIGSSDNRFAEVNAVKINTTQNSVMAGINTTSNGAYNLGEDGTRWGTVYAQAVNCDSTSTMANINPVTLNTGSIGTADKRWANIYTQNVSSNGTASLSAVTVSGDINPSTTDSGSIGTTTKRWASAYINAIETQNTSVMAQIKPKASTNDLGDTSAYWNNLYAKAVNTTTKSTMNAIWPQTNGGQSLGADGRRWNTLFANSLNLNGGTFTNTGAMSQTGDATMGRLTVNTQAQFNIDVKTTGNFEGTGSNSKLQFTANSAYGEIDVSGQKNKKLYFYATDGSGGSGTLYRVATFAYEECEFGVPLKVNNVRLDNLTGRSQLQGDIVQGTMAMFNGIMYYYGTGNQWYILQTTAATPPA